MGKLFEFTGKYDTLNRTIVGVDSCTPFGLDELHYPFLVNVNFPTNTKEIYEIGINFCTGKRKFYFYFNIQHYMHSI